MDLPIKCAKSHYYITKGVNLRKSSQLLICLIAMFLFVACTNTAATSPSPSSSSTPSPLAAPAVKNKLPENLKVLKPGEAKPNRPKKEAPTNKRVAVPGDWETYTDETYGYEFQMPMGTEVNAGPTENGQAFV